MNPVVTTRVVDVVVDVRVCVDVVDVETVDVVTVVVAVTDWVVVEVVVTGTVIVVVAVVAPGMAPKSRMRLLPPPTAHPSCESTIQTAFRLRPIGSGMGKTRVQVSPSQKSMKGVPEPSWTPTAHPSVGESM